MDILRFTTAGSVDDGKSTLIGRLLYETGNIKDDILHSVSAVDDTVNLAHITDGLRAEREQGITIDVAYKYFSTHNRKYIVTDAPGHFQYTKNLVTGASGVDLMIILIDAQNGITAQTKRHSQVAAFLRIKHVVIAVNKMDTVSYSEEVYKKIISDYHPIAEQLQIKNVTYIPVSALMGDNVCTPSPLMPWYNGKTLLHFLEKYDVNNINQSADIRLIVQCLIGGEQIGYAGKLLSGKLYAGDRVFAGPLQKVVTVIKIIKGADEVKMVGAGDNVCLFFEDTCLLKRGDVVSSIFNSLIISVFTQLEICWLDAENDLEKNKEYILRINCAEYKCKLAELLCKVDANSLVKYQDAKNLQVNEFAYIRIEMDREIVYDLYTDMPENGRGILIDPLTNNTVAAFLIV